MKPILRKTKGPALRLHFAYKEVAARIHTSKLHTQRGLCED
jgi:hypothetical protein